jgi:Tfp pilus assembly protein PilV
MDVTRLVLVMVAVIGLLGLAGSLLRLQSQRKQADVRREMALEREQLQHKLDTLTQDAADLPDRS